MSLNPCEQKLSDYLRAHPDEDRFWREKVRTIAARESLESEAATRLDRELWAYFQERSTVLPAWREDAKREGLRRISMRHLAEWMLRVWAPPRPKKPRAAGDI